MHPSIQIPKAEFEARAQELVKYLSTEGLSGAVLFDNYYVTYFTDFAFIPTERPIALAVNAQGERALFVPRLEIEHAQAEAALQEKRERLMLEWGMDPVPDEPTPEGKGRGAERAFSVRNYGMNTWGALFNPRQQLALITFADKVRQAHARMVAEGTEPEFATAVATYLAFGLNRLAVSACVLARWRSDNLSIERAFARQALPMIWDYGEANPFSGSRGEWDISLLLKVIKHTSRVSPMPAQATQSSVTQLPYPDAYLDAVLTDPPYYDNVPYSYLSDFFYV